MWTNAISYSIVFMTLLLIALSSVYVILRCKLSDEILFCLGAPFSGKSKSRVASRLNMKVCGTGDLLRKIAALAGTKKLEREELDAALKLALHLILKLDQKIDECEQSLVDEIAMREGLDRNGHKAVISLAIMIRNRMSKQELLPDSFALALIEREREFSNSGIIIDGAPRTLDQAHRIFLPDGILFYQLSKEELLKRAALRAEQEPERPDNDSSRFVERIENWFAVQDELLDFYRRQNVRIVTIKSTGPYWWGVLKTIYALAIV